MGKREQAKQLVKAKQQHSLVIPRGCSQGLSSFLGILGPQTLQGMFIILMYSLRHKTHQLLLSAFQHKEAGGGLLARACRGRTSAKALNGKRGGLYQMLERHFIVRVVKLWNKLLEVWQKPHSWQHSRPSWTGL